MEEIKSHNKSFNHEFCLQLEGRISSALDKSDEPELKDFWCDGVLQSPYYNDEVSREYLLFENVKQRGTIETTSWIGEDGQTEFKTIIHFGNRSLELYEPGNDLTESIPEEENKDWLVIDLEEKILEIFLD